MTSSCVVFRADAGLNIGTGHVMRCLTLADALRAEGAKVVFITRQHRGHIIPTIRDRGYRAITLLGDTGADYGAHTATPVHANWLDADWRDDAAATRQALRDEGADWLVLDHYALDRVWQEAALPGGVRLLVIDDLADRPHLADVLLDQNVGRLAQDYDGLVPENYDRLIGPAHALLRPEFATLRPDALRRRETLKRPERLLVTLGGIDRDNATGVVLDALAGIAGIDQMKVSVVMGANAPWLDDVKRQARALPMHTQVDVAVPDMARRLTQTDLCIGAAGSTAWERCCLGLPTLQLALADNQTAIARSMAENGVALALPHPDESDFAAALAQGLTQLSDPSAYRAMARRAAALTDGTGAGHMAARLLGDAHD
ncbi:UDP-2,4-diacetamido-2,4,6-trideoxy-beta-L-altropyranose hydrolase [Roseobacter sp. CCS2]|uniref:UDP-2,4-diacetamido-2,4, 6-trideoxy-beta-L-altropyranose hydrolase n=1 Tax=Roseobacter sp. CCS2 TaxID=391593 RepID=UPI0000F40045|nr:UDP-2,4-diacetamido-2,4,6-trideoxy-beta-L-altropyranose hydrolase [Roseobacter sp. CCS2]EBA13975.1 probable polysaccharide biosynthesis protein [Roseobacter sp. CCS2]